MEKKLNCFGLGIKVAYPRQCMHDFSKQDL